MRKKRQKVLAQNEDTAEHRCVRRRDGTHVWRFVWRGAPTQTGGARHIEGLDANEYAEGTTIRVRKTAEVTLVGGIMKGASLLAAMFTACGATMDPEVASFVRDVRLIERADRLLADLRRTQASRRTTRVHGAAAAEAVRATYTTNAQWRRWYCQRDASSVTRAKARRAQRAWDEFRAEHPQLALARQRIRRLKAEERKAEAMASADAVSSAGRMFDHKTVGPS